MVIVYEVCVNSNFPLNIFPGYAIIGAIMRFTALIPAIKETILIIHKNFQ